MEVGLQTATGDKKVGVAGESRAFVLLESARLRGEDLMECFGRRAHLVTIHREIGLAGFFTCEPFSEDERHECLALATERLTGGATRAGDRIAAGPPELGRTLATMFSETISASDALAAELAIQDVDDVQRDRLHLVHAHVMSACELLDERLTVLELQGAGADAPA